ncbi:hypothetical protein ABGB18_37600 [Nonomuraea sp. B12E4]|uniref:hypothetical protein n=1 Tax=Nonomuraea sp. B12E4 TaxID=3153564 RepID=UPI00325D7F9C
MFSRTKRFFGVAALALAAATALAAPGRADATVAESQIINPFGSDFKVLKKLRVPFCLPSPHVGLPPVDVLMPELTSCAGASAGN